MATLKVNRHKFYILLDGELSIINGNTFCDVYIFNTFNKEFDSYEDAYTFLIKYDIFYFLRKVIKNVKFVELKLANKYILDMIGAMVLDAHNIEIR